MSWVEIGYYVAIVASIIGIVAVFIPAMRKEIGRMINAGKK